MLFERFVSAVGFSSAGLQPRQAPAVIATSSFLRRAYHSSTVADSWLYIDGGQFSFMNNGTPQYEYASSILSIDLSSNWSNATVAIHSTTKPDGVPNLNHGSLWYDERKKVLYTGYTGSSSSFDVDNGPSPPPESVWTFKPDDSGSGTWNQVISSQSAIWTSIQRTNRGYQAYGNGSAYVLGGTDSNLYDGNLYPGMVKFDMSSHKFSNISANSGATSPSGNPGFEGAMQYVPVFGPAGVFVVMGGEDSHDLVVFDHVLVYDPDSGSWYNQTTTGNPPAPRVNFCAAGAASTNDTYEIFVYAGDNGNLGTESVPFDTINILSLPAFNWFSVAYNPQNPRSGHTCEGVGGGQIAIIGGIDSNPKVTTGDFNSVIQSTFTSPDPFAQGLAIFDLRALKFTGQYTSGGGALYDPNPVITQFYQGSSYSGNLVEGVAKLMKETHFPAPTSTTSNTTANTTNSPTPSSSNSNAPNSQPHSSHAGAIAGGVIGGVLIIAITIAVMLWLLGRNRRRKSPSSQYQDPGWNTGAACDPGLHEKDGSPRVELQDHPPELGPEERHELDPKARSGSWAPLPNSDSVH